MMDGHTSLNASQLPRSLTNDTDSDVTGSIISGLAARRMLDRDHPGCTPPGPAKTTGLGYRARFTKRDVPKPGGGVLLGDLTGRYAAGSYSRLGREGQVAPRMLRQGLSEHGHRITAAVACLVARVGGTVDQLTHLLMHPDHEGGRHTQNIVPAVGSAAGRTATSAAWAAH